MRSATLLSSRSNSRWAAESNSIVQFFWVKAMLSHHFFERDCTGAPGAEVSQPFFRNINIFKIFEMLQDGLAGVVSFGAASALGEAGETFFDILRKANS
jgi:hypothetical protein